MRSVISLAAVLLALLVQSVSADIYFGGVKYNAIHFGGQEFTKLFGGGAEHHSGGVALGGARRVGTSTTFGLTAPNPGGLTAHNGTLYMAAWANDGRNAGLFSVNTTTGAATRVGTTANNFGVNPAEDVPGALASHGGVLYMVGDRNNALYTVNATTGVATRVGSATAFGNSETTPGGLASYNGTLYLLGRSQGLSTLNTTTGAATTIAGVSGAGSVHGMTLHGGVLYALADTQRALFSLNPTTAVATQVGSTAAGFGVGENDPRGVASFNGRVYMVGNTLDALLELTVPEAGAIHTFTISARGSGQSFGYNAIAGRGSIATGSTASYNTPTGKWVTVIHARSVRDELNFSLGSTATSVADFPTRIVATKTTGGVVSRTFTPQSGSYQPVTGGSRQDYDAESGSAADVFVNNATIRLELYY